MPRFFADIDEGSRPAIDDIGFEAIDIEDATRQVKQTLAEMAHESSNAPVQLTLKATVRDETGARTQVELVVRSGRMS